MDSAIDVVMPGAATRYLSARRTVLPSLRMALECGPSMHAATPSPSLSRQNWPS